jgi:hypothetical protein
MVLARRPASRDTRGQADKTLFLAGTKEADALASLRVNNGAVLCVVSVVDGKKLAEYELDSQPVFDGMAGANGRLYLATKDGKILCFAGRDPALREPK